MQKRIATDKVLLPIDELSPLDNDHFELVVGRTQEGFTQIPPMSLRAVVELAEITAIIISADTKAFAKTLADLTYGALLNLNLLTDTLFNRSQLIDAYNYALQLFIPILETRDPKDDLFIALKAIILDGKDLNTKSYALTLLLRLMPGAVDKFVAELTNPVINGLPGFKATEITEFPERFLEICHILEKSGYILTDLYSIRPELRFLIKERYPQRETLEIEAIKPEAAYKAWQRLTTNTVEVVKVVMNENSDLASIVEYMLAGLSDEVIRGQLWGELPYIAAFAEVSTSVNIVLGISIAMILYMNSIGRYLEPYCLILSYWIGKFPQFKALLLENDINSISEEIISEITNLRSES